MPKSNTEIESNTVAIEFLVALAKRGIKYAFGNAGTDYAPIIEAMVIAKKLGLTIPEIITVPHENVAMSMAHGYYRISGEPTAVMVHVTVGTANALCGVMNAARDNIPILLIAGKTPNTESGHPGSRGAMIHWGQDTFDQGGVLREYVKWDYELRAGQSVDTIVGRAMDIAMSEPRGPVYLTLPREVVADTVSNEPVSRDSRPLGASKTAPSNEVINDLADSLVAAKFPLIVTSSAGRDAENVIQLARLTEEFAIPVVQAWARDMNLPSGHSMNLGMQAGDIISQADVILVIDCEVPWSPAWQQPAPDTKLIHMAPDPFFSRYPLRGHEVDLSISASTSLALPMLFEALRVRSMQENTESRRNEIQKIRDSKSEKRNMLVKQVADTKPIHPAWVAACVNQVKQPDTIIINEMGVPFDELDLLTPLSYITSSLAGGLGFGLGASLGARLATPDQNVILICGDGSYMFGNPLPVHYLAHKESLPTLTIILNNQRWNAVYNAVKGMYPNGHAVQDPKLPLVHLDPSPDYEDVIKACGGYGECVEDPGELLPALNRGLDKVNSGIPALINVITQ